MATEKTPLTATASDYESLPTTEAKKRVSVGFVAVVLVFFGALLALFWPASSFSSSPHALANDHGFFCGLSDYETGYVTLANKEDDHYFYWYIEASDKAPSEAPLVMWLTGGPGAPSTLALLSENGPCLVQYDGTAKRNPYAWSTAANVIWLDQPTNVGFSYGSADDADRTGQDVGENIYWFLQGFIKKHPELDGREFFITGESYGGHYVPEAAHAIWQHNKKVNKSENSTKDSEYAINLQGIAIGNGLTDPIIQSPHYIDMVDNDYNITFVNASQLAAMRAAAPECERLMRASQSNLSLWVEAEEFCTTNLDEPMNAANRNMYDIREYCDKDPPNLCIPTDHIEKYLNRESVRELLHVSKRAGAWEMVNMDVNMAFTLSGDVVLSYSSFVADMLNDDIRVLIYAGDADLTCNWYGNQAWTKALEWDGKTDFNAAQERIYTTDAGVRAGVVRSFQRRLTFLRVFNAGHMVPQHQPQVALDMLTKFLTNQEL